MSVANNGDSLRTLLGSCVGLSLYDRHLKIGGLAHIVLPSSKGKTDRPGKYVDTAVPTLIEKMERLAKNKLVLTAKIAGGASMFENSIAANIGGQNIQVCEELLRQLGIPIVGKHCAGNQGRRMSLNTSDGSVVIAIVGKQDIRL